MELELENGVKSFSKATDRILVSTQKGREIECDLVLLSVGIRPENTLAIQADLKIGPTGGIAVDDTMKTSDPNIYAVGDAVEVRDIVTGFSTLTALAGPANILKGDMEIAHWSELDALQKNGAILIDLRTQFELNHVGKIEGALHIPIDNLRSRLSELDKQKIAFRIVA